MGDIGAGLVSPTVSLQPGVGSLYTLMGGHVSSPLPHGHHDQGAQATACISHLPGTLWDGATFLARWDLAPKELDGGLGMDLRNFVCSQVLRALAPSCGCSATSPVSRGLLGCCGCLGLSCAGWSPGRFGGPGSLSQHGGSSAFAGFGLVSHSSWDLIVARNSPSVSVLWV